MRSHKAIQQGRVHTLYDTELLSQVGEWLFEPAELERRGLLRRRTVGRRAAFVFDLGGRGFVLRHFWRGGLVGRIVSDRYLWTGFARSRPAREWELLATLSAEGLPVPRPAALRVTRSGLCYRADLITVELPATRTLVESLAEAPLPTDTWLAIGRTLGQLHRRGAYHADLNARNILLDDAGGVFVIDWDRGRLRAPEGGWQTRNLKRLFRSLRKISSRMQALNDTGQEAQAHLERGYAAARGE